MSFSSDIKTELCAAPLADKALAAAEAYGVLLFGRTFSQREVRIVTASDAFADRLPKLFFRAFGVRLPEPDRSGRGHRSFRTDRPEDIAAMFDAYGLDMRRTVSHHVNLGALEEPGCSAAFLRGAFLAGGSVTDPVKNYHMELSTAHYSVSRECAAMLAELDLRPGEITRGGNYVLYYKKSERIEDLLSTIGATTCAMRVMSAKVEKSMTNSINRKVNCDAANVDKTVAAAQAQLEAIRRIDREYGLDTLPEPLQQAALLRFANPEVSLTDLARLSYPPVSRSTLSYRLKKLMEYKGSGE